MFDKLVESTNQKQTGRNKFYLVTSLIYGSSLSVLAVGTILWFNPGLAEANSVGIMTAPPPVPIASTPIEARPSRPTPQPQFVPPLIPIREIPNPNLVPPAPRVTRTETIIPGTEMFREMAGPGNGGPVSLGTGKDEAPPPPAPRPTPKAEPSPTPTPKPPDIVRVSSILLQGKSLHKVQPPYPQIAKTARIQGTVQVAVVISQEGHVFSAEAVSGHPLLREAAVQAARQWVFSPTNLNGSPVKVAGVISFNFILN